MLEATKTYYKYQSSTVQLFEVLKTTAKTVTLVEVSELAQIARTSRISKEKFAAIYEEYKPEVLTEANAKTASVIISTISPEWGVKRFTYDAEHGHHTRGSGCNSATLFSSEFKNYWVTGHKE